MGTTGRLGSIQVRKKRSRIRLILHSPAVLFAPGFMTILGSLGERSRRSIATGTVCVLVGLDSRSYVSSSLLWRHGSPQVAFNRRLSWWTFPSSRTSWDTRWGNLAQVWEAYRGGKTASKTARDCSTTKPSRSSYLHFPIQHLCLPFALATTL